MNKILFEAYDEYNKIMSSVVDNYWDFYGYKTRRAQCATIINTLLSHNKFSKINVLETGSSANFSDGTIGLFLGLMCSKTGGKMYSVDIDSKNVETSKLIFNQYIPTLDYQAHTDDSVTFLKNFNQEINLIHLDSYDFNLFDPLPSALHGWREFEAIKDKLQENTIIIIDDNYLYGTYVQWFFNGTIESGKNIDVPILGKGAHIYQWVLNGNNDWKLIGDHYNTPENIKVIIQKI